MPDRATFRGDNWKSYTVANKEFANCAIKALKSLPKSSDNGADVPLIWIHDYHLMLAANWIRQVLLKSLLRNKLIYFNSRRPKKKIYHAN